MRRSRLLWTGLALAASLGAAPLMAADSPASKPANGAKAPKDQTTTDISADGALEISQPDKAYIARVNAKVIRGTVTMTGDTLIAFYRNKTTPGAPAPAPAPAPAVQPSAAQPGQSGLDTGNEDIWRVVGEGHVHLNSEGRDAYSDRLDYDEDQDVVVMTGGDLHVVTPMERITARDSLEYWQGQDMSVARGDALIVKTNGESLAGDVIGAHFVKNADGNSTLKTIEVKGHVVITTMTDIVHGDEGVYDLAAKRAVVFGNIRVTRGESELEGESADVNMDTGISQVFAGKGQRVRALLVPQKDQQQPAGAPPATSGKRK